MNKVGVNMIDDLQELHEAAKNSFKRELCKKDMDLAEKVIHLFATLPPTYGRTAIINTLLGNSPATKNRPEYGWARANGYGPSQLKSMKTFDNGMYYRRNDSFIEVIENLVSSMGAQERAIITALETFDGDAPSEEKLDSTLNDASNGCLSRIIEMRKGAKDAYNQLSPIFAKMKESLPETTQKIEAPKKPRNPLSPLSAFKRALTSDYVERVYSFLENMIKLENVYYVNNSEAEVCGLVIVPQLFNHKYYSSGCKWKEELEDWLVTTKKIGDNTEYRYQHFIVMKDGNNFTQLTHTVIVNGNTVISAKFGFMPCDRFHPNLGFHRYLSGDFKGVYYIPPTMKDHPREVWMKTDIPSVEEMKSEELTQFFELPFQPIIGEISADACKKMIAKALISIVDTSSRDAADHKTWACTSKRKSGAHNIREFDSYSGYNALVEDDGQKIVNLKVRRKTYE